MYIELHNRLTVNYSKFGHMTLNNILIQSKDIIIGEKIDEYEVPYEGGSAKLHGIIPIEELDTDLYECTLDHFEFFGCQPDTSTKEAIEATQRRKQERLEKLRGY